MLAARSACAIPRAVRSARMRSPVSLVISPLASGRLSQPPQVLRAQCAGTTKKARACRSGRAGFQLRPAQHVISGGAEGTRTPDPLHADPGEPLPAAPGYQLRPARHVMPGGAVSGGAEGT